MKAFLKSKNWRVAALVCLVALAVTVSGAFAWYMTSRRTDASVQVVTSEEGAAIVCGQYTVYVKTRDKDGNPVYQVYNALSDDVTLGAYDSVLGNIGHNDQNEDTAIIMKIPVSGTALAGSSDLHLRLTLSRENRGALINQCADDFGLFEKTDPAVEGEKDIILHYLTNIASFRFSLIPELNSKPSPETIYETAKETFKGVTEVQTFASAKWDETAKAYNVTKDTNQLTWDINIPNADISNSIVDGVLNLYIEIDYDEALVAAYLQNHKDNILARKLGVSNLLDFVGDLVKAEIALPS